MQTRQGIQSVSKTISNVSSSTINIPQALKNLDAFSNYFDILHCPGSAGIGQ